MSTSFFFNDTATTEIYTLSLHDALPISAPRLQHLPGPDLLPADQPGHDLPVLRQELLPRRRPRPGGGDRKSTRLNSSHANISYAVFCLKKKTLTQLSRCLLCHRRRPLPR